MITIISANEDISLGIKGWIDESVNNKKIVTSLNLYEPIINYIVNDHDALLVSVLFNTSKFILLFPKFHNFFSII